MAIIRDIQIENFRVHDSQKINFSPDTTIITGKNGTGKTSILEAVYIALQGTSFKTNDKDCIQEGKDYFRIKLTLSDDTERFVSYEYTDIKKQKQIKINSQKKSRLSFKDKIPVILFEPNDLRLLHGAPDRRRAFIDAFISQINPIYTSTLHKYERALKQRNKLLKTPGTTHNDMFAWDIALSEYGAEIIAEREVYIEKINTSIGDIYTNIAQTSDTITLHYSHTYIGSIKQKILKELTDNYDRDSILGYTSSGPHRHDILFQFNHKPALSVASRGEIRTIVIALKLLEAQILEYIFGQKPIVLLDDLFSELDSDRQQYLSEAIQSHQIIITSTQLPTKKTKSTEIKL